MNHSPQTLLNADSYVRCAPYVPRLAADLLDWLAAKAGESILDLGCGDGFLSERIAARQCNVLAVDVNPAMVALAQKRGLRADVMDGQQLPYSGIFDAVFSNAALHWMADLDAVLHGVHRSLRPGGRFVAEMGGCGNVQSVVTLLEEGLQRRGVDPQEANPWTFPTREAIAARLERAGFVVSSARLFQRPTRLPHGLRGWIDTFAGPFLRALPEPQHATFIDEVVHAWEARQGGPQGPAVLDYVRLRFCAVACGN